MEGLCEECLQSSLPLKNAAWKAHNTCLEILVKKEANVNKISEAFISAIRQRNIEGAELLLEAGIDVNHQLQFQGRTSLMIVAAMGHHSILQKLIAAGASVNKTDRTGRAALHYSTSSSRTELLINNGADVNMKDNDGCTPLHIMAQDGNLDCTMSLIAEGADVNVRCKKGETPLIKAAKFGKVQQIASLLQEEVDVNAFDLLGKTALFHAADKGNDAILELLLKAGADVNAVDSKKKQVSLVAAASRGHMECIRILLHAGADVNTNDHENHTALTISCLHRHHECIQLLLESGADVNLSLDFGSALHVAVSEGSLTVADLLIRAGADVNVVNSDHQTSLMVAVMKSKFDCVKLLLRAGAEVRRRDKNGFSALQRLQELRNGEIIALLHAAGETREHVRTDDPTLCLNDICRREIREQMLEASRVNLLVRVPHLGLPPSLVKYLLYDAIL